MRVVGDRLHTLLLLAGLCLSVAVWADNAADAKKADADKPKPDAKAEEEKKKADEAKKKADEEKKKADDAKKKAEAEKKKAEDAKKKEEAKKKAEEERVRQDDSKNWKPRDFATVKQYPQPGCVLIKDAGRKNNAEAEDIEGKDVLGDAALRLKLRGFTRVKIKNDGTDSKGWPVEWLKRAENGAALIFFTTDMGQVAIFDESAKTLLNAAAISKAADVFLKNGETRKAEFEKKKAEAAEKAKQEAANRPKMPEIKPLVPGLDETAMGKSPKDKEKEKEKPKTKDPVDE